MALREDDNIKVMIVDDDPIAIAVVYDFLTRSGFGVIVAVDGESALEHLNHIAPDIILLDVMLPGQDGFSVCRTIRQKTTHVPVIFMTMLSETADIVKGFEAGGVDYLTKPLRPKEVLARIHTHVSISRLNRSAQNRAANLEQEVRNKTRQLERADAELRVRDEERHLMSEVLMRSTEAIILTDRDNLLTYANPSFSRLFGYALLDVIGKPIEDIIGIPGSSSPQPDDTSKIARESGKFRGEVLRRAKDGSIVPVLLTVSCVLSADGALMGYSAVITDLTSRMQAENEVKFRSDLLQRLSPRELAVAKLYGDGKSYKEIARHLDISPATVRNFLQRIYSKLNIVDKVQLAALLLKDEVM